MIDEESQKYWHIIENCSLSTQRIKSFIKEKLKKVRENIEAVQFSKNTSSTDTFTLYSLKGQEEVLMEILNAILMHKFSHISGDRFEYLDKIYEFRISFGEKEPTNED